MMSHSKFAARWRVGVMVTLTVVVVVFAGCSNDASPLATLATGNVFGVTRIPNQVDRVGIPVVNTVFIPAAQKNAYNQGDPTTDVTTFRPTIEATITAVRAAVLPPLSPLSPIGAEDVAPATPITPAGLAAFVSPDQLTLDFSAAGGFPNGRQLADDVIDAAVGLTFNRGNVLGGGAGISDAIANDSTFLGTFPYLGTPR